MTDLPSIMDKIRILRSSRRKTYPGKNNNKTTSVTMAPVTNSEMAVSNTDRQWVPFLVLDISQSKDSPSSENKSVKDVSSKVEDTNDVQEIPLLTPPDEANASPVRKTVPASTLASSDRTVIKTTTSKRSSPRKSKNVPVACTIMVSSKEVKNNSKVKHKKVQEDSLHPPALVKSKEDPVSTKELPVSKSKTVGTASVVTSPPKNKKEVEVLQSKDANFNTTSLAPVGCVICSKLFSTLIDMQTHYLSEHKNRRSRENRKRPIEVVNTEPQKMPNLVTAQEKETTDEPSFKFPLYVNENDPKCPVCSIAFKNPGEVKNHVKLVHSYRCSECNDTFYTLFEFTGHKCNKVAKKVKRIRKKSNRSATVNQEVVAKAMKSFVPIQPNLNKNSKSKIESTAETSASPELQNDSDVTFVPISSSSPTSGNVGNHRSSLQVNTVTKLQITNVTHQPEVSVSNVRTPSPELTIAPLDTRPKPVKIRVLETKNLRCFKFKKDEVCESPLSKSEVIQEKITQLKNNPHVSVSWIPKIRMNSEDDDNEYVCGRCNVICDDMEDYMDHIQDCLTITSVTLEKTSNPPQRILKLQKEISSFGFQETNNNKYSVNKNLMKKLQEVIPLTEEDVRESSPTPSPCLKEMIDHRKSFLPDQMNVISSVRSTVNNVGINELGLQNSILQIKEEPLDFQEQSESALSVPVNVSCDGLPPNMYQLSRPNSKGTPPMVIIPVDQTSANKLLAGSELSVNNNIQAAKLPSPASSSPSSPWDSSPYDLMIDTDDIKMEVEEEVIDDYENF